MAELHSENLSKIDQFYEAVERGDFLFQDYDSRFNKRLDEVHVRFNIHIKKICKKTGYNLSGHFVGWVN